MKDHLGSPRAFVDWSGELIALRDYYAFGKSWLKPNSPATSDLSRFNGKEERIPRLRSTFLSSGPRLLADAGPDGH